MQLLTYCVSSIQYITTVLNIKLAHISSEVEDSELQQYDTRCQRELRCMKIYNFRTQFLWKQGRGEPESCTGEGNSCPAETKHVLPYAIWRRWWRNGCKNEVFWTERGRPNVENIYERRQTCLNLARKRWWKQKKLLSNLEMNGRKARKNG